MIHSNNDKYKGEWLNDMRNGYGKIYLNTSDIYKGEWLNDLIFNFTKANILKRSN